MAKEPKESSMRDVLRALVVLIGQLDEVKMDGEARDAMAEVQDLVERLPQIGSAPGDPATTSSIAVLRAELVDVRRALQVVIRRTEHAREYQPVPGVAGFGETGIRARTTDADRGRGIGPSGPGGFWE